MISRGSSNASSQIRKAKSSAWAQPSQHVTPQSKGIDLETAHQQALSAASLAFNRASERVAATTKENGLGQGLNVLLDVDNGQRLERKQSIRFAGPNAVPLRNRSITRRVAPCNSVTHGTPNDQQSALQAKTDYVSQRPESYNGASPQKEGKSIETYVSSLPTSYRRLRKARSMFTSRDSRAAFFTNETPQKKSCVRSQRLGLHSDDSHQSRMPSARIQRSFSFLRGEIDHLTSSNNTCANHDAAINIARDQYFYQIEQQKMKEKPSLLALGKSHKTQKAFRKTVRSGSSNSYGPAIGSSGTASTEQIVKNGFGHKARSLSLSLKNKIKRVFHRPSDTEDILPIQQLDASRPHFGGYMSTPSGADQDCYFIPSPDSQLLRKARSRESLSRNTTCFLDKGTPAGSIRSFRSDGEINNGKSRVTSWTDSTAADTVTSSHLLEKKRLSIIQEHGGPHQSSATAPTHVDLGDIFQKPIRASNAGARHGVIVDSQRVYSALQKRIFENQRFALLKENGLGKKAHSENGETQISEHQQDDFSLDVAANGSMDGLIRHEDDVFHTCAPGFSDVLNHRELLDMGAKLTPQQIAEQNESSNPPPKRPLREVKSAFFPSSMRIERRNTSPYRRIMDTSSEGGPGVEDMDENIPSGTGPNSVYRFAPSQIRSGSVIGSASIYSRTSSGNTPKRNRSSFSLTKSDSSEEPGTVVIITPKAKYSDRSLESPVERKVSSNKTSKEWQEWVSSETIRLEHHAVENIKTYDDSLAKGNGHKREGAQIDGENTEIGRLRVNDPKPKQPVGIVQTKAVSRPIMKHPISRPITNRKPLVEIGKSTASNNHEQSISTPKMHPATSPHWSSRTVDEKLSFGAKKSPSILRSQASHGSFESQRSNSLRWQRPYQDFDNSLIDPQVTVSPARSYERTQARQKDDENNRPERSARIFRMLSNNYLATPELGKSMVDSYHKQENQGFAYPTLFTADKEDQNSRVGAGLLDPIMSDSQSGINRKLVDLFLSSRRRNMRISEESGTDAAFL